MVGITEAEDNVRVPHYRYYRGYLIGGECRIYLEELYSIKSTTKGYWITGNSLYYLCRFVLKDSRKRYAYPTKEEAMNNFKKRTESSLQFAEIAVKNAKKFLKEIKALGKV